MNRSSREGAAEALPEAILTTHERRRPGRTEVDAALLPLLRGTVRVDLVPDGPPPEEASEAPVEEIAGEVVAMPFFTDGADRSGRGMLIGLLLSVPLWGVIAAIGYWTPH